MRNRGFKVIAPTLKELRNVFDLRELLELHAAAIVARKSKKNLKGLVGLADDIAHAVNTEDIKLYLEADRSFHRLLTAAAENDRLTEMVMGLRDQMRLYGLKSRAGLERQKESTAEHYMIIELATAGDPEGLTNLLRHHIRAWEPIFVETLSRELNPREPIVAGRSARATSK
jgi:DNA-binding GntR family transcriptional regulator